MASKIRSKFPLIFPHALVANHDYHDVGDNDDDNEHSSPPELAVHNIIDNAKFCRLLYSSVISGAHPLSFTWACILTVIPTPFLLAAESVFCGTLRRKFIC